MFSKLQYISQGATAKEQWLNIQQALNAGCDWIQLRFKNAETDALTTLAGQVKTICAGYNATFIVNDHAKIAREIDADGVHLGLTDMPVAEARKIVGDNKITGGTANTLTDVLQRVEEGCSYIGLGPLRFTATKEKLSPVLGFAGYKNIMAELKERQIHMPVYAIGGIELEDTAAITQAGVHGVAVSRIITHHQNKAALVKAFNSFLYGAINHS